MLCACAQFVDDVLIDAPFVITQEMISSLKIDVVVTGSCDGGYHHGPAEQEEEGQGGLGDMYALPKRLGLLRTVQSSTHFTVLDFVERIQDQKDKFSTK